MVSNSDPFGKFLVKNIRRRLTLEQVKEIIGESSLSESEACVARDKDLALIQRALLNSAGPLCCPHDRLEN
jgi:hypothetical protein